jgi:hypothetical protein
MAAPAAVNPTSAPVSASTVKLEAIPTPAAKIEMPKPPPVPVNAVPAKAMPSLPRPASASAPANSNAPAKSGQVSLELVQPGAKTVYVAGSFNEWKPERSPLMPKGNGRWVGDLAVKPGRHEYLFVVDGKWIPDPNAKESVQNPFGGKNSVLIVSA